MMYMCMNLFVVLIPRSGNHRVKDICEKFDRAHQHGALVLYKVCSNVLRQGNVWEHLLPYSLGRAVNDVIKLWVLRKG